MRLALVILVALLPLLRSKAATIYVSDFTTLSNAFVNTVVDGDTIWVTNSFNLTSGLTARSGIRFTLRGDSFRRTVLTVVGSPVFVLSFGLQDSGLCTIRDLTIVDDTSSVGMVNIGANAGTTTVQGRYLIYNCVFTNAAFKCLSLGYGGAYGLVTHTRVSNKTTSSGNEIIFGGNEWLTWALTNSSNPMGTTNLNVVEDTVFERDGSNGHFDAYNGAQAMLRYNDLYFASSSAHDGVHGYDSQVTSTRFMEIYGNRWFNGVAGMVPYNSRGGVLLFHDNIYNCTGCSSPYLISLQNYRACNGAYQGGLSYSGYLKTNTYKATATGGTATTLQDTNLYSQAAIAYFAGQRVGYDLVLVSGTGSGQTLTTSANTVTNYTVSGGTFSPVPDATTGYELRFKNGQIIGMGNQPTYKFVPDPATSNVNRYVKLGATMAESLTNLMQCINLDPAGAGVTYAAITTNSASGRNLDLLAISVDATTLSIVTSNILDGVSAVDGTYTFGYPGAQMPGVLRAQKYGGTSNDWVYGSWEWNNYTVYGGTTNDTDFAIYFSGDACNGINLTTAILQSGRDYFNDSGPGDYAALAYPHPLAPSYATPNTPSPANGISGVSTTPTLSWSAGEFSDYTIYLDTVNPPVSIVSTQQITTTFTPAPLSNGVLYYWKIVASTPTGDTNGVVWNFTTGSGVGVGTPSRLRRKSI